MSFPQISLATDATLVGMSDTQLVYFVPKRAIAETGAIAHIMHILCGLNSTDAIMIEGKENTEIFQPGKASAIVQGGRHMPEFTINFAARDRTSFIFAGIDPRKAGNDGRDLYYEWVDCGHLIFVDVTVRGGGTTEKSEVYPVSARISMAKNAIARNGENEYSVTFYNTNITYASGPLGRNKVWVGTCWLDNGSTITNADAPDGVLTDFVLGTENGCTGSPAAYLYDSTRTGYFQYFQGVWLNGVLQTTAQVTYTSGTRTITFATAPANGAEIKVIYAVDLVTTTFPYSATNDTDPASPNYGWPKLCTG